MAVRSAKSEHHQRENDFTGQDGNEQPESIAHQMIIHTKKLMMIVKDINKCIYSLYSNLLNIHFIL